MLDNLRGMAVFASVVDQGSFSRSAKELGITTSAVSQQIRALEGDLGVVLLHRTTRKLSLTEAGEGYYESAKEVVQAAEKGRIRITQLRDDLSGSLRISTTPELAMSHLLPALSSWIMSHDDLDMSVLADNKRIDLIDERIDIAIRISVSMDDSSLTAYPLADVRQLIVASPEYLKKHPPIETPKDLKKHQLICINLMKDCNQFNFVEPASGSKTKVKMGSRFSTNNVLLATDFAKQGHGLVRLMDIDAQEVLKSGELVEVLPNYQLPSYILYAVTLKREQQPAKVTKCLEVLRKYFNISS